MWRRLLLFLGLILVLALAGLLIVLYTFNLSALPEPGRVETSMATQAKRWLIRRAARSEVPPEPPENPGGMVVASMIFSGQCATCHGSGGRKASDLGRWMYPRATDLGSPQVQRWSDAELYWIIANGIRLSGMPAFAKQQTPAQIWDLVRYVRSLAPQKDH